MGLPNDIPSSSPTDNIIADSPNTNLIINEQVSDTVISKQEETRTKSKRKKKHRHRKDNRSTDSDSSSSSSSGKHRSSGSSSSSNSTSSSSSSSSASTTSDKSNERKRKHRKHKRSHRKSHRNTNEHNSSSNGNRHHEYVHDDMDDYPGYHTNIDKNNRSEHHHHHQDMPVQLASAFDVQEHSINDNMYDVVIQDGDMVTSDLSQLYEEQTIREDLGNISLSNNHIPDDNSTEVHSLADAPAPPSDSEMEPIRQHESNHQNEGTSKMDTEMNDYQHNTDNESGFISDTSINQQHKSPLKINNRSESRGTGTLLSQSKLNALSPLQQKVFSHTSLAGDLIMSKSSSSKARSRTNLKDQSSNEESMRHTIERSTEATASMDNIDNAHTPSINSRDEVEQHTSGTFTIGSPPSPPPSNFVHTRRSSMPDLGESLGHIQRFDPKLDTNYYHYDEDTTQIHHSIDHHSDPTVNSTDQHSRLNLQGTLSTDNLSTLDSSLPTNTLHLRSGRTKRITGKPKNELSRNFSVDSSLDNLAIGLSTTTITTTPLLTKKTSKHPTSHSRTRTVSSVSRRKGTPNIFSPTANDTNNNDNNSTALSGMDTTNRTSMDVRKIVRSMIAQIAQEDDESLQKLVSSVKHVKPRLWLCDLAYEMGFTNDDIANFEHIRHIYTMVGKQDTKPLPNTSSILSIPPNLPPPGTVQDSTYSITTRSRLKPGKTDIPTLKPAMVATMVYDKRTGQYQMLSQGHVPFLLANCSSYWDGHTIWSLTKGRRETLLSTYQQWKSEDLDVIGLAYDPVTEEEKQAMKLLEGTKMNEEIVTSDGTVVYKHSHHHAAGTSEHRSSHVVHPADIGLGFDHHNVYLLARDLKLNANIDARNTKLIDMQSPNGHSHHHSHHHHHHHSHHHHHHTVESSSTTTDGSANSTFSPAAAPYLPNSVAIQCESRLLRMQSGQIFVGMVAARYQPQPKMQTLINNLNKSGIRFTYMASRNYRQTKPLAQKMGLETGWNSAISLLPRRNTRRDQLMHLNSGLGDDDNGPNTGEFEPDEYEDEFGVEGVFSEEKRRKFMGADVDNQHWDLKAQLPHGIPEIRTHLKEKDNVPLLVSLFTDSTPPGIAGMIRIMQENGEQVLVICSALKKSTPLLFNVADLGIAIAPPNATIDKAYIKVEYPESWKENSTSVKQLMDKPSIETHGSNAPTPSSGTSSSITAHALPLPLMHPYLRFATIFSSLHAGMTLPAGISLHVVLKTITEARRGIDSGRQTFVFVLTGQLFLGLIYFINICTAMPQVLPLHHLLWLTWVMILLIALPLLTSPMENGASGKEIGEYRMPLKRPLTADDEGYPVVWDILPGPNATLPPAPSEQERLSGLGSTVMEETNEEHNPLDTGTELQDLSSPDINMNTPRNVNDLLVTTNDIVVNIESPMTTMDGIHDNQPQEMISDTDQPIPNHDDNSHNIDTHPHLEEFDNIPHQNNNDEDNDYLQPVIFTADAEGEEEVQVHTLLSDDAILHDELLIDNEPRHEIEHHEDMVEINHIPLSDVHENDPFPYSNIMDAPEIIVNDVPMSVGTENHRSDTLHGEITDDHHDNEISSTIETHAKHSIYASTDNQEFVTNQDIIVPANATNNGDIEPSDTVTGIDSTTTEPLKLQPINKPTRHKKTVTISTPHALKRNRRALRDAQWTSQVTGGTGGYDPKTGGVRAEGLIRFTAYSDITSYLAGNTIDICDESATLAQEKLNEWLQKRTAAYNNKKGSTDTNVRTKVPQLSAAAAAAEIDFFMGIPPVQGSVEAPPKVPLPNRWKDIVKYGCFLLLPAGIFHEYMFERSMATYLQNHNALDTSYQYIYPLVRPLPNTSLSLINEAIAYAQGFTLLSIVTWLIISSGHFMYRSQSIIQQSPLRNKVWVMSCILALGLQLLHSHIIGIYYNISFSSCLVGQSWDLWFEGFLYHIISFGILMIIKYHDSTQFEREMKMLRLLFDTRLGMYSPR